MDHKRDIDKINEIIKNTNEHIKEARKDAREATVLAIVSILISFIALGVRLTM